VRVTFTHRDADRASEVGIVGGRVGIRAEVRDVVAVGLQRADHPGLVREPGVIGRDRDAHGHRGTRAAAASSTNHHSSPSAGLIIPAGTSVLSTSTDFTTFVFSDPDASMKTRAAALMTGSVTVKRSGIAAAAAWTAATGRKTS